MARTKRRGLAVCQVPRAETFAKTWKAAGYIRLSIEDSGKPGAETLESQKHMVSSYIESHSDLALTALYCDNGHTGTDFERPEFDRLMAVVKTGGVDCIVVKDLSRFGRNYKETGNYLERVFPFLNVRFISISDNFDTLTAERNEYGFIVPLKNMINETYSRDISKKISTALAVKEARGEFIGVWAPYGYQKTEADRHKLEPNPETAPVIRQIFTLRLERLGYEKIARTLNEQEILSPSAYLYRRGLSKNEKYRDTLWAAWNIKTVLSNEVYLGHLVQGKRTNTAYKQIRNRPAPPEEWRITRNAHEAIISEEVFAAAQALGRERKSTYEATLGVNGGVKSDNMFRGLVYCADCGKALSRRQLQNGNGEFYYSFICVTAIKKPSACTRKNLSERELLRVVSNSNHRYQAAVTELEQRVIAIWETQSIKRRHGLLSKISAAERELVRSCSLYDGLYQSLVDGVLSQQEYLTAKERYGQRRMEQEAALEALRTECRECDGLSPDNPLFTALRDIEAGEELSAELIHSLIERIEYGGKDDIRIRFAFQDEFELLERHASEAVSA